jgi:hypothetical protein
MAISSRQFLPMLIQGVIFHDVPRRTEAAAPILSDVETPFDVARTKMLKDKLVGALASTRAYSIEFDSGSPSKVPAVIAAMTTKGLPKASFIRHSQELATYLFAEHSGNVSPGLMCVIDVRESGRRGVALMKLERESGAQLQPMEDPQGRKSFELSIIDNIVFTDGTKLFKAALFIRVREDPPEFEALACDGQLPAAASSSMARFWLRFLGAKFVTEPRVATKQFFEVALKGITNLIENPIDKANVFGALHTEMTSNDRVFSPRAFIERHIPETYRVAFQTHLKQNNIGLNQFEKDPSDITSKLKRRLYETAKGVTISVSEEDARLVEVRRQQVVVNDELQMVK